MSQMFYAVLAGERGKKASANARLAEENYEAAKSWEDNAKQWQQSATQWKEHSMALRSRIVEWQKSAIESEANARAAAEVSRHLHNGAGPRTVIGEEQFDSLVENKKNEIIEEWGVNPWGNESQNKN